MVEATVSATEIKNNFGKYIKMIIAGNEVIITKNGQEIGRLVPRETVISSLTDSLTGILKEKNEISSIRETELGAKYGRLD